MAEPSRGKVARVDDVDKDFISKLPRNIIDIILQFLPIQDTVRTSVLSRNWRYQWTTIPNLVFDDQFLSSIRKILAQKDPITQAYMFGNVISKLLIFHKGPILKFFFKVPYYDFNTISDYLNQWIALLSRSGIKELSIDNSSSKTIKLHPHYFSCLKPTHLMLRKVLLYRAPATFEGFAYLTNLELHCSGSFNLKCPLLERLTLEILVEDILNTNIQVQAPNLKFLSVGDLLVPFTIEETAGVFSVSFSYWPPSMLSKKKKMVNFLLCFPRIESFFMTRSFLEIKEATNVAASMENFGIENFKNCAYNNLQTVKLSYVSGFKAEIELIKQVLAHSPVLKTIFIHRNEDIKAETALMMAEEIMQVPRASRKAEIKHMNHPM